MAHPLSIKDFWRRTGVGFIVLIWILAPYAILQQFSLYEVWGIGVWQLQEQSWDRLVPVCLAATPVYFSYVFLLAIAGYYSDENGFVRFLKSVSIVALVSHLTFFFIPTGLARPDVDLTTAPALYHWLVSVDLPRNCLPSLHASLAMLATLALAKRHLLLGGVALLWTIAILWSAIALRQHITLDLAAGGALAVLVWGIYAHMDKKRALKGS